MAQITYYGHSCFTLSTKGKTIIFDPFISPNPLASGIDISGIHADFMLISHGHGDHIADAVIIAQQNNLLAIGVYEITEWLQKQGVKNTFGMNTGGSREFDFGKLKLTNAVHSSSFPDGTYAGNPVGFLIESESKTIYYAGDTALTSDMMLIGEFNKPDFAFLPIGDNFTMGIDDAIKASSFLKCNTIIAMHFDTFGYITIDKETAQRKFNDAGLNLILPEIGKTFTL